MRVLLELPVECTTAARSLRTFQGVPRSSIRGRAVRGSRVQPSIESRSRDAHSSDRLISIITEVLHVARRAGAREVWTRSSSRIRSLRPTGSRRGRAFSSEPSLQGAAAMLMPADRLSAPDTISAQSWRGDGLETHGALGRGGLRHR